MTELLRQLEQAGFPLVVVLGDPGYYGRFGFQPSASLDPHYLPVEMDSPYFQILRLRDRDDPCLGAYRYSWEPPDG
jgi:putative acetyltransferase